MTAWLPARADSKGDAMILKICKRGLADRREVLVGVLSAALSCAAPKILKASPPLPRVLFICQFGTAKSAIARELFKRRAAQRGIPVSVFSRGITPEPHLASSTRDELLTEGIVLDTQGVRKLRAADLSAADIVVFFNPLPARLRRAKQRDWSAVPSVNETYPLARADLDRRINLLIDELALKRP